MVHIVQFLCAFILAIVHPTEYIVACSPFAPKSTRTITTLSGLAVCLLLFFFYIFGKKTFSEEARCEAKVWMDTVLLFSIWLGFPLSWNFFTSKWFVSQIFLAITFVHHHQHQHTKSLLFSDVVVDSYMQPSVKHPRFQGCAALEATGKRLLSTYILQTILAKSFA